VAGVACKAANGEIIAASHAYETNANAENGIEGVKTDAPGDAVSTTPRDGVTGRYR
jgi:uncharacterized protein YegP (UPF0339 family)